MTDGRTRAASLRRTARRAPAAVLATAALAAAVEGFAPPARAAAVPAGAGIEFFVAPSANLPVPLEVRQGGFPAIRFRARWRSETFEPPIVWVLRASRVRDGAGWALETMHHKLYLVNPPPEIGTFSISHGLNLVTLQRVWSRGAGDLRVGLGAVVAHPESEVRGRRFAENRGLFRDGYYVAGPALTAGAGRAVPLAGALALVVELRASVAPVRVPVVDGDARLTNVSVHLMVGLGGFARGRTGGRAAGRPAAGPARPPRPSRRRRRLCPPARRGKPPRPCSRRPALGVTFPTLDERLTSVE